MAGVVMHVSGLKELDARLKFSLAGATPQARLVLAKNLGVLALSEEARYFREQQSPSGAKWKPLAPRTIAGRRKGKGPSRGGAKILMDKGPLRLSVTPGRTVPGSLPQDRSAVSGFDSAATGAIRSATPEGFTIGTALVYARTHQEGRKQDRGLVRERFQQGYMRKGRPVVGHRVRMHWTILPPIPARPFVGFSERFSTRAMIYLERWFLGGK